MKRTDFKSAFYGSDGGGRKQQYWVNAKSANPCERDKNSSTDLENWKKYNGHTNTLLH